MMLKPARLAALLALLGSTACGPKAGPGPVGPGAGSPDTTDDDAQPGEVTFDLEPVRIDVVTDDEGTHTEATDARTLLIDGNDALMQGKFDEAIAAYDRIIADFPDSQLLPAALYNSGIAYERKGDADTAVARYQQAIAKGDGSEEALDARFRLGDLLASMKQYAGSEQQFSDILDSSVLSIADRLEALSKLGYVRLELKDYVSAEETLRSVLAYHQQVQATEHVDTIYYVVMAQYYLAAIPQRQFEVVPLRYPEEQMAKDLDHKSELFLLARDRYVKAAAYGNLYWTSASLYQLGAMYRKFWDDFMLVPIPADLDPAAAKEYVKLINKNEEIQKLIRKSLVYHEKNIDLGKSVPQAPVWVAESAQAAAEIRDFMARQQKGELFVPGSVPEPTPGPNVDTTETPREYIPARTDL